MYTPSRVVRHVTAQSVVLTWALMMGGLSDNTVRLFVM